jgi:hypothetical protein
MTNTDSPKRHLPPATRSTLKNALVDFVMEEIAVQGGPIKRPPFVEVDVIDKLDAIRTNSLFPVMRQILETLEDKSDAELRACLRDAQQGLYSRKGHWRDVDTSEPENSGETEVITAESRS